MSCKLPPFIYSPAELTILCVVSTERKAQAIAAPLNEGNRGLTKSRIKL